MAGRGMKDQSVYELNKTQQYIMQMRPVLHKRALFCDGTADGGDPVPDVERQCGRSASVGGWQRASDAESRDGK